MRVLIDTNVLADLLLGRDPYYDIAYNILAISADYIVTRNTKDFASSRVPAILPDEFLKVK